MDKWPMVRLGDHIKQIRGVSYKPEDAIDKADATHLPVLRAHNIQETGLNTDNLIYISVERIKKHQYIQKGDIVVCASSGSKDLVGKAAQAKENIPASFGAFCKVVRPHKTFAEAYLKHYFSSPYYRFTISKLSEGANINNLRNEHIDDLQIPLPPLPVQQKIAGILDRASALIAKRKAQIAKLDLLVKARFIDMFGDPVTNPMGWEVKKVIDECECMVPGRDKPKSFSGDIPWITIDDLVVNGITTSSKKGMGLTKDEILEVKRKLVPTGSVLMSCIGNLGICSIAGKELVINQQLHSFQCGKLVNNYYLMYHLGYRVDYMNLQATSTTVLYMNKGVCNSIPLMLPPIELQTRFADFVMQTDKSKAKMQQGLDKLELLYKSLMQKCFKGEVF